LNNTSRVEKLRESYGKDYERLGSRIGQLADKRKAAFDRVAFEAAKALFDAAKARSTAAGSEVAKLEQLKVMTMDDLQKSTVESEQADLEIEITTIDASIVEQKALKAKADTEVSRLKEAKENSGKLADIAEEMANSKEVTDNLVAEFQEGLGFLYDGIYERENSFFNLEQQIDTLRFEADRLTDEKEKARKEAEWDAAKNDLIAQQTQNVNDQRLATQYETQIRAIQNQFTITKSILQAELTVAQQMVVILEDINA
jgi:regulator of replication initiation timing